MRGTGRLLLVAAFLAALLSGCVSGPTPPAPTPPRPDPEPIRSERLEGLECENALLFIFVDYEKTDPYLPPGFHPRDPQEFLVGFPVSFGSAAVLFIGVECPTPQGPLVSGSLAIFVQSPAVEEVPPARFDFYEVARYAQAGQFEGVLDDAGWPRIDGGVSLDLSRGVTQRSFSLTANVTDSEGLAATFLGGAASTAGTTIQLGPSLVRFWHDARDGLAFYEYDTALDPWIGPGVCTVRAGSPLAAFTGSTGIGSPLGGGDVACPGTDGGSPIVATFPDLVLDAQATYWPGVRTG